jgi:hypothetical protein
MWMLLADPQLASMNWRASMALATWAGQLVRDLPQSIGSPYGSGSSGPDTYESPSET